ncbi:hypothetical protein [Paenarthrobacter sp. Y-19]|uniref:hypothetical protein n=1 Tax=Paenarthrobacter sp. Y-19 TaxID=3031125 RepID=UPI0023DA4EDA|nr:hypothetical protein [Paenarthrobacter sp. Y-19]
MDDYSITANEAAGLLGIEGLELRNRLRAERPAGAIQIPNRKNGRWYLAGWYVEQLAAEYDRHLVIRKSAPTAHTPPSEVVDHQLPATDTGHRVWSEWVTFNLALPLAPLFPGVYMFRKADEPEAGPVYIGMAGERKGTGVRGRLSIYASGRGATSGLGEHAMDRALADPAWLQARLDEAVAGRPMRATTAARSAINHAHLEVRWQTVPTKAEAKVLEDQLIAEHPGRLWNRPQRFQMNVQEPLT